jgi:molybdopterin/thiamine biosynthesis adenylyltransferase/rhodanese-related sulfurtransferase
VLRSLLCPSLSQLPAPCTLHCALCTLYYVPCTLHWDSQVAVSYNRDSTLLDLTHDELIRYSRQLALSEVGLAGQRRIKAARVLLVGAGGLGSPAAMYLAAAGVGTLGLVDFDVVDVSNLQRQIIHGTGDVGRPKLESAAARLRDVNPFVAIEQFAARLDSSNAMEIIGGFDVVVDGSDNFPTRYLVNDACVFAGKPYVYGSVYRFEGQVSIFAAPNGPCYRCLFREPPPAHLVPSCSEGGVVGVLPGIIGSIQALEAIKLILGKGETLIGRLALFDALRLGFRELKLRRDPECSVCGENPSVRQLIDYEAFCGVGATDANQAMEITVGELARRLENTPDLQLVDVREPYEWEICRIDRAALLPLGELPTRMRELDPGRETIMLCHIGIRSLVALEILRAAGFPNVRSLKGGIDAWARQVDLTMAVY